MESSPEPDVRDFDHDGNQRERYIREEDVEIRIKEEPVDSDVEENALSSTGVIESTNQIFIPMKRERYDHESMVETSHIPCNSSKVPLKSYEKSPISGGARRVPRVNNSVGIPQKTEECSYSGDNALRDHSSGPSSDNQGPSGVSNSSRMEGVLGDEAGVAESDSVSSNAEFNAYICDVCGERLSQLEDIEAHMSGHVSEKPFRCERCSKGFHLKESLNKHRCKVKVKSAKKPIMCSWCGKGFSHASVLQIHERVHTGERPYECTVCGKSFCHKGDLTRHKIIHTGETPFKCNECGKAFRLKYNLESHMRTHSGERPLNCTKCSKPFSCKSSLNRHMKTHSS